jgi:hypothetical protein
VRGARLAGHACWVMAVVVSLGAWRAERWLSVGCAPSVPCGCWGSRALDKLTD